MTRLGSLAGLALLAIVGCAAAPTAEEPAPVSASAPASQSASAMGESTPAPMDASPTTIPPNAPPPTGPDGKMAPSDKHMKVSGDSPPPGVE